MVKSKIETAELAKNANYSLTPQAGSRKTGESLKYTSLEPTINIA